MSVSRKAVIGKKRSVAGATIHDIKKVTITTSRATDLNPIIDIIRRNII